MAPLFLNGTTGISGIDGSSAIPALQGVDTNTGISFGSDVIIASTGGTERWRTDASGRLLVGTSSARSNFYNAVFGPTVQLEGTNSVNSTLSLVSNQSSANQYDQPTIVLGRSGGASLGSNTIVANNNAAGSISFQGNDGSEFVQLADISGFVDGTPGANDMPGRLVFSTTADGASSPTERMRITSQGNVLIGSTVDSIGRFGVAADTNAVPGNRVALFTSTYTGGDSPYEGIGIVKNANNNSTSNVFQVFYINAGATTCGRINANGAGAAAFGSTSDARLKENIKDIEPQLANICSLRPVEFDYIEAEGGGHQIGFIAQEIGNIYPDSISERDDGMKMLTGWSKTEARLVKALQEAVAKIETLEAKVEALRPPNPMTDTHATIGGHQQ